MSQIAALGSIRVCAFADKQRLDVLEGLAQLFSRERTDDVRTNQPCFDAFGTKRVNGILGRFPCRVQQEYRYFSIIHTVQVENRILAS
ncbi:hypothetical protein D3C75_1138530 [compost metagenome]